MNEPIFPFVIRRPNECPYCGGKLKLLTFESISSNITDDGHVVYEGGLFDHRIECSKCYHRFEVITDKFELTVMPAYGKGCVLPKSIDAPDSYNPFQL